MCISQPLHSVETGLRIGPDGDLCSQDLLYAGLGEGEEKDFTRLRGTQCPLPLFRVHILVVALGLTVAQAGLKSVIPVPQPPLHSTAGGQRHSWPQSSYFRYTH